MLDRRLLTRHLTVLTLLVALLSLLGAGSALAADGSNASRTLDDRDNIVDYDISHPTECWSFFDTIYYGGDIWEAFTKKNDRHNYDDTIGVWVSHSPAALDQPSKPTHYKVIEPGQTWESSDAGDLRRPNGARFAVFKDQLFLYVAKTYDYETGAILWQKRLDPLDPQGRDRQRLEPARDGGRRAPAQRRVASPGHPGTGRQGHRRHPLHPAPVQQHQGPLPDHLHRRRDVQWRRARRCTPSPATTA